MNNRIVHSRYCIKLPSGEIIRGGHTLQQVEQKAVEMGGVVVEFGGMFWREARDKRRTEHKERASGAGA
jgi:hypothetical protein